ncbi:MAG: DUF4292 domain-containing protein [Tannerella sp.]|jgi:hypothetical protein|nr:DUF4292 domain-containing protein [Tannerella sp.]
MKNKLGLGCLCAVCCLLLAGCRTSNLPAAGGTETVNLRKTEEIFFHSLQKQAFRYGTLSAKIQLELTLAGGKTFSSRANLKIRKNDWIQVSVQPLLGIEVFRLELCPDSVWIIDRLNRRYLAENFARLADSVQVDFNFYNLQALFTNQLFLPGERQVPENAVDRFGWERTETGYTLQTRDGAEWSYLFTAGKDEKLHASEIADSVSHHSTLWEYADFRPVGTQLFPMKVNAGWFEGEEVKGALSLNYTRVDVDVPVEIRPVVPSGYERMNLLQIKKMFEQP